jgi:hypothetical protein
MKPLRAILFATLLALTAQCFAAPVIILLQPREEQGIIHSSHSDKSSHTAFHKLSKSLHHKNERNGKHTSVKLQVLHKREDLLLTPLQCSDNYIIAAYALLPDPDRQLLTGPPKF